MESVVSWIWSSGQEYYFANTLISKLYQLASNKDSIPVFRYSCEFDEFSPIPVSRVSGNALVTLLEDHAVDPRLSAICNGNSPGELCL